MKLDSLFFPSLLKDTEGNNLLPALNTSLFRSTVLFTGKWLKLLICYNQSFANLSIARDGNRVAYYRTIGDRTLLVLILNLWLSCGAALLVISHQANTTVFMLQDYRPNFLLPSTWYSFVFPGDSWSILYQFVIAEEAWATVKAGKMQAPWSNLISVQCVGWTELLN